MKAEVVETLEDLPEDAEVSIIKYIVFIYSVVPPLKGCDRNLAKKRGGNPRRVGIDFLRGGIMPPHYGPWAVTF